MSSSQAQRGDRLFVGGPEVAWRATGEEIVGLDLAGSVYFGLNATAASLWRRMTSTVSRADLIEQLRRDGATETQAGRDVDDFLAQLERYGLLKHQPAAESD